MKLKPGDRETFTTRMNATFHRDEQCSGNPSLGGLPMLATFCTSESYTQWLYLPFIFSVYDFLNRRKFLGCMDDD